MAAEKARLIREYAVTLEEIKEAKKEESRNQQKFPARNCRVVEVGAEDKVGILESKRDDLINKLKNGGDFISDLIVCDKWTIEAAKMLRVKGLWKENHLYLPSDIESFHERLIIKFMTDSRHTTVFKDVILKYLNLEEEVVQTQQNAVQIVEDETRKRKKKNKKKKNRNSNDVVSSEALATPEETVESKPETYTDGEEQSGSHAEPTSQGHCCAEPLQNQVTLQFGRVQISSSQGAVVTPEKSDVFGEE